MNLRDAEHKVAGAVEKEQRSRGNSTCEEELGMCKELPKG